MIIEMGGTITDEMEMWGNLAQMTDFVFDPILQSDDEEDEIMKGFLENEMDDDIEDLDLMDEDLQEDEEIVTLRKRRYKKE